MRTGRPTVIALASAVGTTAGVGGISRGGQACWVVGAAAPEVMLMVVGRVKVAERVGRVVVVASHLATMWGEAIV